MIDIETMKTSASIPVFLHPFLLQVQEKPVYRKQEDLSVKEQLQELKEVLSDNQNEDSMLYVRIVQMASECMALDDWFYLCGLLITELKGELPYPASSKKSDDTN